MYNPAKVFVASFDSSERHLLALSKFIRRYAAIRVQPVRNGAENSKTYQRTSMTILARL